MIEVLRKRKFLYIIGIGVFVILLIVFEMLARKVLDGREELELSRKFLRSNVVAIAKFGNMDSIEYKRDGSLIRRTSDYQGGIYAFEVFGSKSGGLVHIHWQRNPATSVFEVTAIVIPGRFSNDTVLWGNSR